MGIGMRTDNETLEKTACCVLLGCPVMMMVIEVQSLLDHGLLSSRLSASDVLGPLVAPPELPTACSLVYTTLAARAHPPIRTRPPRA